jgi:hypothetical protein
MNTPTIIERLNKIRQELAEGYMGAFTPKEKEIYGKALSGIVKLHDDISADWNLEMQDFIQDYENK